MLPGKFCVSCGRLNSKYTEFKCPNCAKTAIIRCDHCKEIFNSYKCEECGFEGP
ncbi:MAG: zinc finger domain-containing protein [Candidatus Marsarchaeota archaeon]|nr:zinc finger domain-containing protein [Candidatus Marsarchaeota archaeon]MCL5094839.1 zinc finger domain-containing protein [Candidatus Marsarchaeota archaeon]